MSTARTSARRRQSTACRRTPSEPAKESAKPQLHGTSLETLSSIQSVRKASDPPKKQSVGTRRKTRLSIRSAGTGARAIKEQTTVTSQKTSSSMQSDGMESKQSIEQSVDICPVRTLSREPLAPVSESIQKKPARLIPEKDSSVQLAETAKSQSVDASRKKGWTVPSVVPKLSLRRKSERKPTEATDKELEGGISQTIGTSESTSLVQSVTMASDAVGKQAAHANCKRGLSIQSIIPRLPWRPKNKRQEKKAAAREPQADVSESVNRDEAGTLCNFHMALSVIHRLCCENRLLDAMMSLKNLEGEVVSFQKAGFAEQGSRDCITKFSETLTNDTELIRLKSVYSRFNPYLQPAGLLTIARRGPEAMWNVSSRKEAGIGEHFRIDCKMRFLEASERTEGSGTTQVMFCITVANWPQKVEDFVALDRETDLFSKDLIEDCKQYLGVAGGHDMLLSSMLYYVIRPVLLPFSFANLLVREFAVCHESPVAGYPPGVLVNEYTPPASGGEEYEGFLMPPDKWAAVKVVRETIKHFTASSEHTGCSQVVAISKAGIPLPQWMVPLKLLDSIFVNTLLKTMANFKTHIVDKWDDTEFARRMAHSPEFYEAVRVLNANSLEEERRSHEDDDDASSATHISETPPLEDACLSARSNDGVAEPRSSCIPM